MYSLRLRTQALHNMRYTSSCIKLLSNRKRLVIISVSLVAFFMLLNTVILHSGVPGVLANLARRRPEEVVQRAIDYTTKSPTQQTIADFQERKELYLQECQKRFQGKVAPIFTYPPKNLTVCLIPKAGSTFWKRVFKFLHKDFTDAKIQSIFDLSRHFTHFAPTKTWKELDYKSIEGKKLASLSKRVMFTRDPYQRLWSGYVDKFFLPDSWADHGRAMMFRRPSEKRKACPDDIEFEEFLQYALRNREDHWRPVQEVCDPCTFQPDYIGHMETFSRDVEFILKDRGLDYLIKGHNHKDHVEDEIRIIVDYHFAIYKERPYNQDCLNTTQLAARLWESFQLNGYFRPNNVFPEFEVEKALENLSLYDAKEKVTDIFIAKFRQGPATNLEWATQRRAALKHAYRSVSGETLNRLVERYNVDFKLFGYDPQPPV